LKLFDILHLKELCSWDVLLEHYTDTMFCHSAFAIIVYFVHACKHVTVVQLRHCEWNWCVIVNSVFTA